MNPQLFHCLWLAGSFLLLFTIAELLYHKGGVEVEYTRKLVHLGTGVLTLLFPVFLTNHWYVMLLCGSFAVILITSKRFGFLKSINAIQRKSHGSISYPIAVYGAFLFSMYAFTDPATGKYLPQLPFFYIPILTLAVCDPLAALSGKRFSWKPFKVGAGHKTLSGSITFFVSAFLLSFVLLQFSGIVSNTSTILVLAFCVSFATTIAEAFSPNGLDNVTIPGAAILVLFFASQLIVF